MRLKFKNVSIFQFTLKSNDLLPICKMHAVQMNTQFISLKEECDEEMNNSDSCKVCSS